MSHVDAVGNFPCFMKVRIGFISNPRGGIWSVPKKKRSKSERVQPISSSIVKMHV